MHAQHAASAGLDASELLRLADKGGPSLLQLPPVLGSNAGKHGGSLPVAFFYFFIIYFWEGGGTRIFHANVLRIDCVCACVQARDVDITSSEIE